MLNRMRWFARSLLRLWPRRRHAHVGADARHALVLFAGTYGDFVQLLPMLTEVARLWPKAEVGVYAPSPVFNAFTFALPPKVRLVGKVGLFRYLFKPADLLCINAAGVYRVRYEIAALRLGRVAAGFRYAHETHRAGLGWSVPLTQEVRNFAEANRQLPSALSPKAANRVSGSALASVSHSLPWPMRIDVNAPFPFGAPVLFSVGSAGFRRDVGLTPYLHIIDGVVKVLAEMGLAEITFVAGPGDADVITHLRSTYAGSDIWLESAADLAEKLRTWPGGIIGFNSFMAHFALYLGRRMAVLHHTAVPHGYDCGPFHRQLVLTADSRFDLAPVREFLAEANRNRLAMMRQKLPGSEPPGKNLP
jgi:hypothetical protein